MINVKNGKVHVDGLPWELMSDLACIIASLRENEIVSDEFIRKSIEVGFMDEEELRKNAKKSLENIEKFIASLEDISNEQPKSENLFNKMFGDLADE